MEESRYSIHKARRYLQIADHLVNMTYKILKESKLLLSSLENIFLALTNAMTSLLNQEAKLKKIPQFNNDFDSRFKAFKNYHLKKRNFDIENIYMIKEIKETLIAHKKSSMEFTRQDRLVICSDNYNMKVVTAKTIKDYLSKAKLFIEDMDKLISQK